MNTTTPPTHPRKAQIKSFVFVCMNMKHVVICMLIMGQSDHRGFLCLIIFVKKPFHSNTNI